MSPCAEEAAESEGLAVAGRMRRKAVAVVLACDSRGTVPLLTSAEDELLRRFVGAAAGADTAACDSGLDSSSPTESASDSSILQFYKH